MKPDSLPSKHDGLFQRIPGFSHHEIVIGHPMHNIDINQMPVQHVFQLLTAYRTRQRELWRHKDVRYVTIFRSHGTSSGTSYGHPHSQILATAVVPGFIHNKHKIAQSYLATTQKNLYSEILEVEESSDRMIERNETMSVFVPFAALVPYEMWIMPRGRHPSFSQATDPDLEGLADTLHRSITRLKGCCGEVAYSYMIYSCPVGEEDPSFSWYLEIAPRLARPAGADLGPHTWVNPVPPEVCAENLRKISQVESQDLAEVDVLGLGLPKEVQ
jgi:UDPglucose--hexose-1-phosphate uridylyltransferase